MTLKEIKALIKQIEQNIKEDKNYCLDKVTLAKIQALPQLRQDFLFGYIGEKYAQQDNIDLAIYCLQQISKTDLEKYAQVQLNLGVMYGQKKEFDQEIASYLKVPKEFQMIYAQAQLNLGGCYEQQGNLDKAIECCNYVLNNERVRIEHQVLYAMAQFNLGIIYDQKGDIDKAIEVYRSIPKKVDNIYVLASIRLCLNYLKQKKLDQIITCSQGIFSDSEIEMSYPAEYAQIKLIVGIAYRDKKEFDAAIACYQSVPNNDETKELFVRAQWHIAHVYLEREEYFQFFKIVNILRSNSQPYLSMMGVDYLLHIYQVIEKFESFQKYMFNLLDRVKYILTALIIRESEDILIAHYTTREIAYRILDDKNSKQPVSKLRLNPTDFMNDPTEGELIDSLFKIDSDIEEKVDYKPFIGCFTLHHDSLNQFRLYGKEQQQEASGLSLVLNRIQLFNDQLSLHFVNHTLQKIETIPTEEVDIQIENEFKLPLYRCIYFDPDSGLIHIAHR